MPVEPMQERCATCGHAAYSHGSGFEGSEDELVYRGSGVGECLVIVIAGPPHERCPCARFARPA